MYFYVWCVNPQYYITITRSLRRTHFIWYCFQNFPCLRSVLHWENVRPSCYKNAIYLLSLKLCNYLIKSVIPLLIKYPLLSSFILSLILFSLFSIKLLRSLVMAWKLSPSVSIVLHFLALSRLDILQRQSRYNLYCLQNFGFIKYLGTDIMMEYWWECEVIVIKKMFIWKRHQSLSERDVIGLKFRLGLTNLVSGTAQASSVHRL